MILRAAILGLLVATAAGVGISSWALLSAQSDNTFQPTVIDFSGSPTPDPTEAARVFEQHMRETPTPLPVPDDAPQPVPWPPPELKSRAIDLAVNDAQVSAWITGHRYGAFSVDQYTEKQPAACSDPYYTPCAVVVFYDYTVSTGIVVIVNLATGQVLDRRLAPEIQPPPGEDELQSIRDLLKNNPSFGPGTEIDIRFWPAHLIDDTDMGGHCGTVAPLHRCLQVRVTERDGSASWVTVDMVDGKIVAIYGDAY